MARVIRTIKAIVAGLAEAAQRALFATGIGGLGLLGWRRKRRAQAAARASLTSYAGGLRRCPAAHASFIGDEGVDNINTHVSTNGQRVCDHAVLITIGDNGMPPAYHHR
jgi:hypothetical protein